MALEITLGAVGVVRSNVTEIDDREDWSGVESTIEIDAGLAAGLRGLADYTHIVVVFYLHRFRFNPATDLVQPPPRQPDAPPVGIFALRIPQRPNALGVTTVRLLGIDGTTVRVKGLDAVDGSPVLDIRPPAPPIVRVATLEVPIVDPAI